jgi:hypothetical protein
VESEYRVRPGDSMISRFFRWLQADDSAKRYPLSGLVAYYWTGGTPKACSVRNISSTGMYVFTDERWLLGSVIPMTLQRGTAAEQDSKEWIAVLTRVVRSGPDGFGLAFVCSKSANLFGDGIPPERMADNRTLKQFLAHLRLSKGSG